MNTIFHIEGRGSEYIFHFMIYMIGGFRYILNKTRPVYMHNYHGNGFEHNVQNRDISLTFPINIYIQNYNKNNLNDEILSELSDKFKLITDLTPYLNDKSYQIINNYGEANEPNTKDETHIFLRNLFLKEIYTYDNHKFIYITRNNSELLPGNNLIKTRHILNEIELFKELKKLNFKFIQLEEYNFKQKIKLFNTSSIIISPHSGALTFSLFANKNTDIIEICHEKFGEQYKGICKSLKLKWQRYSNLLNYDSNLNMNINILPLINIVNTCINNKI